MKKFAKTIIAATAVLAFAATAVHAKALKKQNPSKNQVELMFYQHAKEGKISIHADKKECYSITLSELSPNVVYFSNFPSHVSGRMNLEKFNTSWKHAETADGVKPNAVLHAYNNKVYMEQSALNMTVTLSDLKYNQESKTMSYTACPLNKDGKFTVATESTSATLYGVDLFIDPIRPWPP